LSGPLALFGAGAGAVGGGLGGFFGGLSGAMETGMTTAQLMQEAAQKEGLNWGSMTDDERFKWVRNLTNNQEAFDDVKSKALARGITIGAIDGVVGAVSGGVGGVAFKTVAGTTKSALAGAARVSAVAALETGGGMASEYYGQKAAGQEMNLEEIMIEGFADKTFTGISAGKALVQGAPKYSINGQTLNGREFNDALKMMDDEAYVSADIKVENSPAVERVVNNRRQNISIDQDIDSRVSDVNDRAELIKLEKQVAGLKGNETVSGKNKLNNLKTRIKEITSKYEGAEIDATVEQRKQAVANAIDDKFEASFNKNLKAARGAAAKKGTKIDVFEDDDSNLSSIAFATACFLCSTVASISAPSYLDVISLIRVFKLFSLFLPETVSLPFNPATCFSSFISSALSLTSDTLLSIS
jgi:archaellum component FlaC